jgi:hypothetical protein
MTGHIKNQKTYSIALFILITFIAAQHISFFLLNEIPVIDHEYYHTGHMAVDSYYQLKDGKWHDWAGEMFSYSGGRQPSMIGRIMGAACYIFGLNRFVMRQVNLIFYIILILSAYHLGKKLFGKKTGFWGAFISASMPLLISHSRRGDLHFFAAALFTASLLMLVKSGMFRIKRFSVFFGIIFGLTLHTHETILLYLAILSASLFADIFINGDRERKKNLILAYTIILFFFAPFYLPAFMYPAGEMAMRLYPRHSDFTIFSTFVKFLQELKQGIGQFNFYAAVITYICLLFATVKKGVIFLFTILICVPFLIIVTGSIFYKEVDTLQYIMPSYPLIGITLAYALGKIRYNIGIHAVFIGNILLWIYMALFMAASFMNINPAIRFPHPLTIGNDTKMTSMFYPKKDLTLNAKEIRAYFKDLFKNKKADIYGFMVPTQVIHCGYFNELMMNGIIRPGKRGFLINRAYTGRNQKDAGVKTIYILIIYKDTGDTARVRINNTDIPVDRKDYLLIKKLLSRYNCGIIKEFYQRGSSKKIMTVIGGHRSK